MSYGTVNTRYKAFQDFEEFDEIEKPENKWERMGLPTPQEELDAEEEKLWYPIKIRIDQVVAISQEDEDIIVWTTGASFIVDMTLEEAESKFNFK